jgi:hypothetical protein
MTRWILVAVFSLSLSQHARAQTMDNALRGLDVVRLAIENLDEDSKACGITEDLVRNAFMFPASAAKFKVVHVGASVSVFYINVLTLRTNTPQCISSVTTDLRTYQPVDLKQSNRTVFTIVVLWNKGRVFVSNPNAHAEQVKTAIEGLTKEFVIEWNLDNKP